MKRMMQYSGLVFLMMLICSGAQAQEDANADTARAKALQEGWPDTPVGLIAAGWIDAFSTDEAVMRTFLAANLTEEALVQRPMKKRLSSYRKLHEQFGNLMLSSVVEATATDLTAIILAEDTAVYRFIFEVEKQAPHKLLTVSIVQSGNGHGGY
jgi:hypothetical protein